MLPGSGGGETTSDCVGGCAETWVDVGMLPGGGETTSGCVGGFAETREDVGMLAGGGGGGEDANADGVRGGSALRGERASLLLTITRGEPTC